MIIDLPNSEDYKTQGKEWLLQSFDIVYDYAEELKYLEDWKESDWHFHKGKLSTVLVLIHQAIESVLKSEIIETSPFLLIDMPSKSWPTLPASSDKSYNELFTINSDALLRIFCATCRPDQDKENLVKIFEEARIKRNQIVHGINKDILIPEYLIKLQCSVASEFYEDSIWNLVKNEEMSHPLYEELEDEDLITELCSKFKHLDNYLSKGDLKHFFEIDGRGYLCPSCNHISQDWDFKPVYLFPNNPTSTGAKCIICNEQFVLIREECRMENCKGNVLILDEYEDKLCLTCLEYN